MPLNLSGKWTASFSTTCKLLIILALLLSLSLPAGAASAESTLSGGDILLLHGQTLDDGDLANLRQIADGATALGRSLDLAEPGEAIAHLTDYKLVICYDLKADPILARRLVESQTKLLVLGGGLICDLDRTQVISNAGDNGVLQFDFSGGDGYGTIVTLPENLYRLEGDYRSGSLETLTDTLSFCAGSDTLRYIPLTDMSADLTRAALMWELSGYLWEYNGLPPQRGQYWVLDNVYAYMPAQELLARVERLAEAKIPFVLSVYPTFQNGDYPAMGQFCQVLRYAQAAGGGVILRVPELRTQVSDWAGFSARMTDAVTALTDHGVYPLGYDVPYSWLWDEDALIWMRRSRTVFLHEDEDPVNFTRQTRRNIAYDNYNNLIFPVLDLAKDGQNTLLQFPAAQRISASVSLRELEANLDRVKNNRNSYYSLWDSDQSLWADNLHLSYHGGSVTLNDELQSLAYTPEPYEENHDYQRNILKRFTVSLQNESHFLIGLVAVVTVLFLGMILYARAQTRKYFFYPREKEKHSEEKGRK